MADYTSEGMGPSFTALQPGRGGTDTSNTLVGPSIGTSSNVNQEVMSAPSAPTTGLLYP